jgi:DNA-binding ferritin-like protein (Dps family)
MGIVDKIIGDLDEKKAYRANEARAKALPEEFAAAYREIQKYIFSTSGIYHMDPLKTLVDMFEEAAANGRHVSDITGTNVAAFVDELVSGTESFQDHQRAKLNKKFNSKKK